MADNEELHVEQQEPGESNQEVKEPSVEDRARAEGWRPKEDWQGDENDFVDAKEFLNRKPLFEKIESQSRQIKNINKTLEALKQHHSKVNENAYQRALAELQRERMVAISEGDGVKFQAAENRIKQAEHEFAQLKQVDAPSAPDPSEFVAWKGKNDWYEKDDTMRTFADAYGVRLAKEGLHLSEVLDAVSKKVRQEFSHKFVNPNKKNAPDVGVSSGRSSNASDSSERYEMDEVEKSIMNTLVRSGTMTKEQYIKELKAVKARGR